MSQIDPMFVSFWFSGHAPDLLQIAKMLFQFLLDIFVAIFVALARQYVQ